MDYLRQGIHLRGYAQKNPEQEYKKEAFNLFVNMLGVIKSDVVTDLSRVHVPTPEELAEMEAQTELRQKQCICNLSACRCRWFNGRRSLPMQKPEYNCS